MKIDLEIGRNPEEAMGARLWDSLVLHKKLELGENGWQHPNDKKDANTGDFCTKGFHALFGGLLGLRRGQKGRFRITITRIKDKE